MGRSKRVLNRPIEWTCASWLRPSASTIYQLILKGNR